MTIRSRYMVAVGFVPVVVAILLTLAAAQPGKAVYAAEEQEAAVSADTSAETEFDLSSRFPGWAQQEVIGIAAWQFIAAFVLVLLGLVLKKISDFVFARKIIPLLEKTPFEFDHRIATAASKPFGCLLFVGGVALAVHVLVGDKPGASSFLFDALTLAVAIDVVWFLFRAVDVGVHYLAKLAARTESTLDDQLIPIIRKALKVTVGLIGFVWMVELLGGSVTSLLAGLGIGGLAVALALQDTLANFFGSVFILLDRPFGLGDRIKVGDVEGTVEEIGFRSTRVRTYPATVVTIPNKAVADATVDNMSKMPKRRVKQTIGVTYETTANQMEQAVKSIRELIENDDGVDKESITVHFTDFAVHVATKERINLAIMRKLDELGLSMAFPTQTVYFEGEVAERLAGRPRTDKNRPES